jgi:hypothetical protein
MSKCGSYYIIDFFFIFTCKIEKIGGQSGQSDKNSYFTKVSGGQIGGQRSGQRRSKAVKAVKERSKKRSIINIVIII